MEPGLGMLWGQLFRERSMFKSLMNRLLSGAPIVGSGNGTVEGNSEDVSEHYREFWMRKRKGGLSDDFCS